MSLSREGVRSCMTSVRNDLKAWSKFCRIKPGLKTNFAKFRTDRTDIAKKRQATKENKAFPKYK